MFEGYYAFNKANVDTPFIIKHHLKTHNYTFKAGTTRYIVQVEEYPEHIFIIKFFRKADRHSKKRFSIITNENKCTRIVSTCIRILIEILKKNNMASFGFLGANNEGESKSNTQRFRIYKGAMENLIGDEKFEHSMDVSNSTYLMVNKNHTNTQGFVDRAKALFEEIYPSLESEEE